MRVFLDVRRKHRWCSVHMNKLPTLNRCQRLLRISELSPPVYTCYFDQENSLILRIGFSDLGDNLKMSLPHPQGELFGDAIASKNVDEDIRRETKHRSCPLIVEQISASGTMKCSKYVYV